MWKIFCPLLLMLFTFDYPRDRSARAEPLRENGELVPRDDDQDHREDIRKRAETKNDAPRFPFYEDDENSSERIGRWRKNGEALEPKWRDGDTVPLLPFSQLTRYSGDDLDNVEEDEDESKQRGPKYRENGESLLSRNAERKEEMLSRERNNRPVNALKPKGTSNDEKEKKSEDLAERRRESTSTKYREAFQVRPNDYEHELDDEEYLKPRPRKRRPPQNYEFGLTENETRKPEASGFKLNVPTTSSESESRNQFVKNAMELKSLLKMQQEEGLSLSELLQRRNLTLNDLLKGRADAINALRSKDVDADDYIDERTTIVPLAKSTAKSPQRTSTEATRLKSSLKEGIISIVPVVVDLHENASGPSEMRLGQSTSGKSADAEPPRARGTPPAGILTLVTTSMPFPVATNSMELLRSEESTAKLRGNGEIRIDGLDEDEIMEFSDFPDYKNGRNAMSPVWLTVKDENSESPDLLRENYEGKGSTLSIEQLLNPTERSKFTSENEKQTTTGRPEKEDYNMYMDHEYQDDASAAYQDRNVEATTSTDESDQGETVTSGMEIGNWTKNHETDPNNANYTVRHQQDINETTKKSYDDIVSEVEPEARAEIFELFASGSAGKRLERLLKSRNMSLEELIALRQRGSSKVHLAEVSRIKVPKSKNENKEENSSDAATSSFTDNSGGEGRAIGNNYDKSYENVPKSASYPVNFIQPEEITTARSFSTVATSQIEDGSVLGDGKEEISGRREVQIVDLLTTFDSLPFAKDIRRKFADEYNREEKKRLPEDDDNLGMVVINDREIVGANDTANTIHSGFVKEIVKQEPNSIDIRTIYSETDVFTDDRDRREKERSLSKIRPSIIASGAILGVTIVVFLAIFIACRIKQKQKYRYRNTFSRAVFQGPMLAARKLSNSSSLSTVMVNVIATSTTKRPEKNDSAVHVGEMDSKSDIDNDSLDANDSWETIPDYMK
ncbi:uncharacterized protein LOC143209476 [Lasioglossum baleicum]|uniref:uncharacterized protein LOC143209476 n=1 Tax=Lasioglossum baleicum TaxID=434251 RepID=UPI003FCD484F